MMLPNRALIICKDAYEGERVLSFLESTGEAWWYRKGDSRMYYGSCHKYDDSPTTTLCYSLQSDGNVGYAPASWYQEARRRDIWENQDDPSWNYISVSDFIRRCGGEDETTVSLEGLL